MQLVDIEFRSGKIADVWVPTRFVERWRGMRRRSGAMLFAASSVHGFGMRRSLTVVGLDGGGVVTAVRRLTPGRVVVLPGAASILELEIDIPAPRIGDRVRFYPRRDAGTSRGVRNADRKPGRRFRPTHRDAPFR